MGRGARFDPDHAWPYRLEKPQHLASSQLPPHDDRAVCGNTVNLENSLRQIKSDNCDGLHDTAPRHDVPDDDTARTAGQVEVVHTITSSLLPVQDRFLPLWEKMLKQPKALAPPTLLPLWEKVDGEAGRMRGARKRADGLLSNLAPTPLIRP